METLITSDTHYNHRGIIVYSRRDKFLDVQGNPDVEAMNKHMVMQHNSVVGPNDVLWHLGDFAFINQYGWPIEEIFSQLNGKKHLIVGNHDEQNDRIFKLPWQSVTFYHRLKMDKVRKAILCHYPIESWRDAAKGTIHLHGHCHGSLKRVIPHRFDAGVDPMAAAGFDYGPVEIGQFFDWAEAQEFEAQDHHAM